MAARKDSEIKEQLEKLERGRRPRVWVLSCVLSIFALLVFGAYPFLRKSEFFSSGPISSKHKFISADCKSCHAQPFQAVADATCQRCHALSPHVSPDSSLGARKREPKCTDCHLEHQGDSGLVMTDSRQCIGCHSAVESEPNHSVKNVANFNSHPEFSVALRNGKSVSHTSLNAKDLIDPTHLKLNHKLHLQPNLRGPKGGVQLQCQDCHKLAADFRSLEPIKFDKDCRSCHSLEFDARISGRPVPHAEPDQVYNFLYAEYAKLLLEIAEGGATPSDFQRFRPGEIPDAAQRQAYVRKTVEDEARNAEKELFTRTGCFLCHEVTPSRSDTALQASSTLKSSFEILPPGLPSKWMQSARFSHGAHEELTCNSCHQKAQTSERTSDLLLPGVSLCQKCHNDTGKGASTACVTCHSYHDSLPIESGHKRDLDIILKKHAQDF